MNTGGELIVALLVFIGTVGLSFLLLYQGPNPDAPTPAHI